MPKDNSKLSRKSELEKTGRFLQPVSLPVQCSSLFLIRKRSSSLDISFSLDTSAKVCKFQSKKGSYLFSYIFKYFENFLSLSPLFVFFPVLQRYLFKQFCMHLQCRSLHIYPKEKGAGDECLISTALIT